MSQIDSSDLNVSFRPSVGTVFRKIMMFIAVIAVGVHATFIGFFALVGVPALAWANVLSVVIYTLTVISLRRNWIMIPFFAVCMELFLHACAVTLAIGWNSGFQLYIFIIMPIVIYNDTLKTIIKIAACSFLLVFYIALDIFTQSIDSLIELPNFYINLFYYFNTICLVSVTCSINFIYNRLISDSARHLDELANTDLLTSLLNRRAISKIVHEKLRHKPTNQAWMTAMLADIDFFKRINDKFGHQVGDRALQLVAAELRSKAGMENYVARWGGEEFLILLASGDAEKANRVADDIRRGVEDIVLEVGSARIPLSITIGVAQMQGEFDFANAINRADEALYQGKREGRNRVVVYAPREPASHA